MALPDKSLTPDQDIVMTPLIENYVVMMGRLEGSQKLVDKAVAAMDAYARQVAEKEGLAVGTDYLFDPNSKLFRDKAAVEAQAAAMVKS